jgi:tyrosinase
MAGSGSNFVRREVWSLGAEDPIITAYAKAVAVMQARPADDPTSWSYQAAIHGTETGPDKALWNQCQHGTWFFLPWHRMFLLHFEEIVRAAVIETGGPVDWALPYWNYGLGGRNATLPLAFRRPSSGDGQPNPLFIKARAPGINSGAALPTQATSPDKALARGHFIGAAEFGGGITRAAQFSHKTGRLEETPHNSIHVVVGGAHGLMANIKAAALDPIFWLHHANIDRLWSVWGAAGGHLDPSEASWRGHKFEFFDKDGHQMSMRCEDVETLTALGYSYDDGAGIPRAGGLGVSAAPPRRAEKVEAKAMTITEPQMIGATEKPFDLVGAPAEIEVPIDAKEAGVLAPDQNVYLNVEDIEGKRNPGTVYGVYADLPAGASAEVDAAHHVGNLSFFGIEGASDPGRDEHAHGLRVAMDITTLAHELAAEDRWAGHALSVSFRPLSLTPPEVPDPEDLVAAPAGQDPPVEIGRVSVFYDA